MSFTTPRKRQHDQALVRWLTKFASIANALICIAVITVPTVTYAVDAAGNVSHENQALSAAEVEAERSQWRYTSQGWRHVSELKVKEPAPEWKIVSVHPLLIVMFEILTACLLLIFCSKRTNKQEPSSDSVSSNEPCNA